MSGGAVAGRCPCEPALVHGPIAAGARTRTVATFGRSGRRPTREPGHVPPMERSKPRTRGRSLRLQSDYERGDLVG